MKKKILNLLVIIFIILGAYPLVIQATAGDYNLTLPKAELIGKEYYDYSADKVYEISKNKYNDIDIEVLKKMYNTLNAAVNDPDIKNTLKKDYESAMKSIKKEIDDRIKDIAKKKEATNKEKRDYWLTIGSLDGIENKVLLAWETDLYKAQDPSLYDMREINDPLAEVWDAIRAKFDIPSTATINDSNDAENIKPIDSGKDDMGKEKYYKLEDEWDYKNSKYAYRDSYKAEIICLISPSDFDEMDIEVLKKMYNTLNFARNNPKDVNVWITPPKSSIPTTINATMQTIAKKIATKFSDIAKNPEATNKEKEYYWLTKEDLSDVKDEVLMAWDKYIDILLRKGASIESIEEKNPDYPILKIYYEIRKRLDIGKEVTGEDPKDGYYSLVKFENKDNKRKYLKDEYRYNYKAEIICLISPSDFDEMDIEVLKKMYNTLKTAHAGVDDDPNIKTDQKRKATKSKYENIMKAIKDKIDQRISAIALNKEADEKQIMEYWLEKRSFEDIGIDIIARWELHEVTGTYTEEYYEYQKNEAYKKLKERLEVSEELNNEDNNDYKGGYWLFVGSKNLMSNNKKFKYSAERITVAFSEKEYKEESDLGKLILLKKWYNTLLNGDEKYRYCMLEIRKEVENLINNIGLNENASLYEIINYYYIKEGDFSEVRLPVLKKWEQKWKPSEGNGGKTEFDKQIGLGHPDYQTGDRTGKAISEEIRKREKDGDIEHIEDWAPTIGGSDNTKLTAITERILGVIQLIGSILSVGILAVLGIKYMLGSVEEKAKYKETLLPYVIGCALIFGVSNFASIIYNIASSL